MCASYVVASVCYSAVLAEAQTAPTPFERDTLASATYAEAIAFYRALRDSFPERCSLVDIGETDAGLPLHLFVVGAGGGRSGGMPFYDRRAPMHTFFVNNGIHAGEPCGVDASMLFARDLVAGSLSDALPEGTQVAIVPVYNVGGLLDRGGGTRANQVGPRAYGFRGNARNYDLNRDFVKRDSRNALHLGTALKQLTPDVFVDTHTTNGADYQYHLTVLATQPEKLGPVLGPYLRDTMLPALYAGMEAAAHPSGPYVYSRGVPQEAGLRAFIDSPRYSSGFAALQGSLAFITEAHMLKPFATRVRATEAFLHTALRFWLEHHGEIDAARHANARALAAADSVVLRWEVDSSRVDTVAFRGYAVERVASEVTGAERIRYDTSRPVTVPTPYYSYARPAVTVAKPRGYLVPGPIARTRPREFQHARWVFGAEVVRPDGPLAAVAYRIDSFATVDVPFEGHYLHYDVAATPVSVSVDSVDDRARYVAIDESTDRGQRRAQWLYATLEPEATDSYFAWNDFDAYLQRKEHYSDYVFEETAARMLASDQALREEFSRKRRDETGFRQNTRAQLDWLYERSGMAEEGYMRYPILRVAGER